MMVGVLILAGKQFSAQWLVLYDFSFLELGEGSFLSKFEVNYLRRMMKVFFKVIKIQKEIFCSLQQSK